MGKMRAEEGEFKGYPIITVYTGKEYKDDEERVIMGARKAAAVVACMPEIRVFAEKHQPKPKQDDETPF